jgi:hypothetical protein
VWGHANASANATLWLRLVRSKIEANSNCNASRTGENSYRRMANAHIVRVQRFARRYRVIQSRMMQFALHLRQRRGTKCCGPWESNPLTSLSAPPLNNGKRACLTRRTMTQQDKTAIEARRELFLQLPLLLLLLLLFHCSSASLSVVSALTCGPNTARCYYNQVQYLPCPVGSACPGDDQLYGCRINTFDPCSNPGTSPYTCPLSSLAQCGLCPGPYTTQNGVGNTQCTQPCKSMQTPGTNEYFDTTVGRGSPPCTLCPPGYRCLAGALDTLMSVCNPDPSSYCPAGSSVAIVTAPGYYSDCSLPIVNPGQHCTRQLLCPAGSFCSNGIQQQCPSGSTDTEDAWMNNNKTTQSLEEANFPPFFLSLLASLSRYPRSKRLQELSRG